MIRALLLLVPAWLWAVLLALSWLTAAGLGWRSGAEGVQARWDRTKLEQAEQWRNQERRDAEKQRRIDDELLDALVAGADLAHAADERLRKLSDDYRRANAPAAQCGNDAPAAAIIRDEDRRDLVALAHEANDAVAALAACQQRELMRSQR